MSIQCPQVDVPCYNLTTYAQNPDMFFQNDSTFIFLPGDHRLDKNIILRHLINIQLRGSNDVVLQYRNISANVNQYGFDPYDTDVSVTYYESSAHIQCDGTFGFAFVDIKNLSIYNLSILNCGTSFNSALFSDCSFFLRDIVDLQMDGVSIQNGTGFGLLGLNVLGDARIIRSSFIGNNQIVKNELRKERIYDFKCEDQASMYTNDESCDEFQGGNAFFLYSNDVILDNSSLHFSLCVFALGVDGSILPGGSPNYFCYFTSILSMHGTGLTVNAILQTFDVSVSISDSVSYRNQAAVGANLLVVSNEISGGTVLTCTNISSVKGVGSGGGIEVHIVGDRLPRLLPNVIVSNSKFDCNYNMPFPVDFNAYNVYVSDSEFNYSTIFTRDAAVFTNCRFMNSNYINTFSLCVQCQFTNSMYIGTNNSCSSCRFTESSYVTTSSSCEQCLFFSNTVYTGNHSVCHLCQFTEGSSCGGSYVTCSSCEFTRSYYRPVYGSCTSCQFKYSDYYTSYSSCQSCQLTSSLYSGNMNILTDCTLLYSSSTLYYNASTYVGCAFLHSPSTLDHAGVVKYVGCIFDNSSILSISSAISLSGITTFANALTQTNGGAVSLYSSTIVFEEGANVTFENNAAVNGGAVYMDGLSSMNFSSPETTKASFVYNQALVSGGAIFADAPFKSPQPYCYFNANTSADRYTIAYFEGNVANEVGNVLYGGKTTCPYKIDNPRTFDYDSSSLPRFVLISPHNSTTPDIASDPVKVLQCNCNHTGSLVECPTVVNQTLYPGEVIKLSLVAVDSNNVIVPGIVLVYEASAGLTFISALRTSKSCHSYTILLPGVYAYRIGGGNIFTFHFTTQKSFLGQSSDNVVLNLQEIPCPVGFVEVFDPSLSCVCDDLFTAYGSTCNISDQTIMKNGNMWIGYVNDSNNSMLLGIIEHCPYDYCNKELRVPVVDFDSQCAYNRTNVLCGQCPDGLSATLGTSQCKSCTDHYLFLIIPFALMGVALVGMLFLLNMTVSSGTLNGLIFYANIIRINDSIFLPRSQPAYLFSKIMSIFTAWVNLDFGIESCFYNGMDSFSKTWLQLVFPTYIFGLVGAIILAGRFSVKISNLRVFNSAVSVLATLILLSFSKFLRTTIIIFSFTTIDTGNITSHLVWTYDGNLKYFGLKHTALFSLGIIVTALLILPYTVILLLLPCLQSHSDWKVLRWVSKLKPLFDCYAGPYKDRYRYWSGVLICVRFPLYMLFASTDTINFRLLGIVIAVLLYCLLLCSLSVYKNWSCLVLETFFHLNLLAITITYLFDPSPKTSLPVYAIVQIGIGGAFVCFVVIVIAHIAMILNEKGYKCGKVSQKKGTYNAAAVEMDPLDLTPAFAQLREPLMDEHHAGVI